MTHLLPDSSLRFYSTVPERNNDLSASTGMSLHRQRQVSTVLNDLEVVMVKSEDSCVIVVEDHDGGGVGHLELGDRESSDSGRVDDDSVLGADTEVAQTKVEVLVLFEDIVVDDLDGDLLMLVFWVESQSSLDWDVIASGIGSSVFGIVVNHNSQSFWSPISGIPHDPYHKKCCYSPSDLNVKGSDALENGVMSWVEEDLASVVTQLLLLSLYQLKLSEVFSE